MPDIYDTKTAGKIIVNEGTFASTSALQCDSNENT